MLTLTTRITRISQRIHKEYIEKKIGFFNPTYLPKKFGGLGGKKSN